MYSEISRVELVADSKGVRPCGLKRPVAHSDKISAEYFQQKHQSQIVV